MTTVHSCAIGVGIGITCNVVSTIAGWSPIVGGSLAVGITMAVLGILLALEKN